MNKIDQLLKPLSPGNYVGAYMDNTVQLYNLMEWCLNQTGKARVTVITFSLSEEFIRKVLKLRQSGLIESISLLMDLKAIQKTQKLIRFSENVFDQVNYCKVHAKVLLIESDTYNVSIAGSQNATRTSRTESTIVSTLPDIFFPFKEASDKLKTMTYDIHTNSTQID